MKRYYIVLDSQGFPVFNGVYSTYQAAATRKITGNSGWYIKEVRL